MDRAGELGAGGRDKRRRAGNKKARRVQQEAVQMCPGSSPAGGVARQALFGSDYMYCLMIELPQLIDRHLLCEPKQQFAMASAEEKWKDESKDRHSQGHENTGRRED